MQNNTHVAMSMDFFDAYSALPKQIQKKVSDFIGKFRSDPTSPGINYEKINGCADKKMCSVRIDDTYRGIVVRQPSSGTYMLIWVDHHDEAYAWARGRSCSVDSGNGALYIVDTSMVQFDKPEQQQWNTPRTGLFANLSEKDLRRAGVPQDLVAAALAIADKQELDEKQRYFPQRAYESLMWLAEGVPLEEVLEDMGSEAEEADVDGNLAEALKKPETLESFVVIDDNEELRRILDGPLEKWRVFLHPAQRRIVERDYKGAARVLGGAGTGKTVVAMHRAKRLASALSGGDKVLFATFTRNLPADIVCNLRKICSPAELARIEVTNIDDWAADYAKKHGLDARIVYDMKERGDLWKEAIARSGVDTAFAPAFFEDEYNRVVLANDDLSSEAYARAPRTGRGTRLDRRRRMEIWPVFQTYLDLLEEKNVLDGQTLLYKCRQMLENAGEELPYRHVIVDETQDLTVAALRLLRAIAGPEHDNDLFVVGDAHQRIYRNNTSLSSAGIHVRGRSSVLRINYRTTEETRDFAFSLLEGVPFDDLDSGTDNSGRCRSLTHGPAPQVLAFRNADEEFRALSDEIRKLTERGVEQRNICVVARTNRLVKEYKKRFSEQSMRCFEISAEQADDPDFDGIRIATMHRVKGLEFQYVFVVSANKGQLPHRFAIDSTDPVTFRESMTAEKCLLYVALTRAQKGAYVMGYGQLSEFLPEASWTKPQASLHASSR